MSEPPAQQPAMTPTVTTAPARRWSRVPGHLGRARTSTVVLVLLFLAIGALYLTIRPETSETSTTETGNQQPADTTTPVAPAPAETTTPAPETTTDSEPTTTEESTPTTPTETADTTTPFGPTETGVPTETLPSEPTTVPTVSPPG